MTTVCPTFNGQFEFCDNISCYDNGCAVFGGQGQCKTYCRNSCQNGQYVVCINNKDTQCTIADNQGRRVGSYACVKPLLPIWAISIIVIICVIIVGVGLFFLIKFGRKARFQERLDRQRSMQENRNKMLEQARRFDEQNIVVGEIDDSPMMLVGRGSGVF